MELDVTIAPDTHCCGGSVSGKSARPSPVDCALRAARCDSECAKFVWTPRVGLPGRSRSPKICFSPNEKGQNSHVGQRRDELANKKGETESDVEERRERMARNARSYRSSDRDPAELTIHSSSPSPHAVLKSPEGERYRRSRDALPPLATRFATRLATTRTRTHTRRERETRRTPSERQGALG